MSLIFADGFDWFGLTTLGLGYENTIWNYNGTLGNPVVVYAKAYGQKPYLQMPNGTAYTFIASVYGRGAIQAGQHFNAWRNSKANAGNALAYRTFASTNGTNTVANATSSCGGVNIRADGRVDFVNANGTIASTSGVIVNWGTEQFLTVNATLGTGNPLSVTYTVYATTAGSGVINSVSGTVTSASTVTAGNTCIVYSTLTNSSGTNYYFTDLLVGDNLPGGNWTGPQLGHEYGVVSWFANADITVPANQTAVSPPGSTVSAAWAKRPLDINNYNLRITADQVFTPGIVVQLAMGYNPFGLNFTFGRADGSVGQESMAMLYIMYQVLYSSGSSPLASITQNMNGLTKPTIGWSGGGILNSITFPPSANPSYFWAGNNAAGNIQPAYNTATGGPLTDALLAPNSWEIELDMKTSDMAGMNFSITGMFVSFVGQPVVSPDPPAFAGFVMQAYLEG